MGAPRGGVAWCEEADCHRGGRGREVGAAGGLDEVAGDVLVAEVGED